MIPPLVEAVRQSQEEFLAWGSSRLFTFSAFGRMYFVVTLPGPVTMIKKL